MKNAEQKQKMMEQKDPTLNVREMIKEATESLNNLQKSEVRRINDMSDMRERHFHEEIANKDIQYQIQFTSAKEAVAAALGGTRDAINKADINTDKRFSLLSEKIDGITNTMNKTSGERGIYVTHSDLSSEMEKLRTSFESMLRPVVTFMNSTTGEKEEVKSVWGYVVGAVGLTSTIILLILRLMGT